MLFPKVFTSIIISGDTAGRDVVEEARKAFDVVVETDGVTKP